MTNFEKYKDDLIKVKGNFAVDKNTKEIVRCSIWCINCVDCVFNEGSCAESDKIKWLCEEYEVEKKVLTSFLLYDIIITVKRNNKEKR